MELDPAFLSRLQFAANISFHILFPSITIGLCWLMVYFRVRYTLSKDRDWEFLYYFWVKIFALTFALGVVSGITMSFQFGTNWPGFMDRAGNIAGPLLGYEVLTAFFLEASFLGIMLFGKERVSNRVHLIACSLVAIGTSLSAFWILSLNSWMQTPAGFRMEDGILFAENWVEVIFNPSFPYRLAHMFVASLLTASFLVAGISAWRMRQKVDSAATYKGFKTAVYVAAILTPTQIVIGDLHGLNTLEHQPAKIAAMEGIWHTESGADLTLFGFPDEENQTTHWKIAIPNLASFILTHKWDGELQGISSFGEEVPPVAPVFWVFRIMVGIGMLMLVSAWWSAWHVWRKKNLPNGVLHLMSWMTFSGWIAVLAGWYVTEIGRQPWVVQGLLQTHELVADHSGGMVLATFLTYIAMYVFLLTSYIATLRYMASKPARSLMTLQQQAQNDQSTLATRGAS